MLTLVLGRTPEFSYGTAPSAMPLQGRALFQTSLHPVNRAAHPHAMADVYGRASNPGRHGRARRQGEGKCCDGRKSWMEVHRPGMVARTGERRCRKKTRILNISGRFEKSFRHPSCLPEEGWRPRKAPDENSLRHAQSSSVHFRNSPSGISSSICSPPCGRETGRLGHLKCLTLVLGRSPEFSYGTASSS